MTQEVLQSLPVTRQRHSLLAVGKNLLNIPDDDPRASKSTNVGVTISPMAVPIVSPPQTQFQNVTLVSTANLPAPAPTTLAYESCKPFKKRVLPDTGFGISRETPINTISLDVQNSITVPRNAKLPRTLSANNVANSINTSIVTSSYNGKQIVISKEEDQENMPQNTNFMQTSSSLMDLTKAVDAERTKSGIKTPSPSYFGSARSLLRNSPINLSMDRRNAHIISPLALTTHNRSNGFSVRVRPSSHIIPPSPTNTTPSGLYRKGPTAPSPLMNSASRYIKLSPTMTARGSPSRGSQQSPILAMRKPFSPTSLITFNNQHDQNPNGTQDAYGQRIKVLKMPSQNSVDTNSSISAIGNNTSNMKLVGLNNRKTVIALVSKNPSPGMASSNGHLAANEKLQSPRSSAINLVQRSPAMYRLSRFASN